MIQDARVLQPEFVPQEVAHRDTELDALTSALHPITRGETGETAFLFGLSGTGKTCIAQYLVDKLGETVIDLNTQYVNCWEDHSRFKTLYRVLTGIDPALDVHRQSTPTDELRDRLHAYDGPPYIVILDEVDQLAETNVLYDLYRISEVNMVLVANHEQEFFTRLDGRVASRLRPATRVQFDVYENEALVAILEDRVQWGLHEDAVTKGQLETIADTAAGDARAAIGVLRSAARQASQDGTASITDAHIADAVPEAKAEIKRKNVEMLPPDQRILYNIIAEQGEVSPGDLYDQYSDQVEEPKTRRMVRYYLQKLCHYNLVQAQGENRGRTYQPLVDV